MRDTPTASERALVEEIFQRIAADLTLVVDRDLRVQEVRAERGRERPAAEGTIHVSFKLGFLIGNASRQGCWLVPLPEVLSLASLLMQRPDAFSRSRRGRTRLDAATKDAISELADFVAGSTQGALCALGSRARVRSDGCQGVREGGRPILGERAGGPLLVGRGRARLHDLEPFRMWLVVPGTGVAPAA